MKVGDMVLYCDSACAQVEPVLVLELVPDPMYCDSFAGAVVQNELGVHWVRADNLVEISAASELLDELTEASKWLGEATL